MSQHSLTEAVTTYQSRLEVLERESPNLTPASLMEVLVARDAVARALIHRQPGLSSEIEVLFELDRRLHKLAPEVAKVADLAEWQRTVQPTPDAWWWSLESTAGSAWLWNGLAVLFLMGSVSLMLDIATRFLIGVPDWLGALLMLLQAAPAVLTAGGVLTKAGRETIQRFLSRTSFARRWGQAWRAVLAAALLVFMILARVGLVPRAAQYYNDRALNYRRANQLTSALSDLKRAISLIPEYSAAHYNLGLVHDDLFDTDRAKAEYQVAALGGLDAAYNNLARLYILDKKPWEAVTLLLNGLDRAEDNSVRYSMLKNLGWALIEQKRFSEAVPWLRQAVDLDPTQAAGHCLLAQAVADEGDIPGATVEWEACLKYASSRQSGEEDQWIGQARQFLAAPTPTATATVTAGGNP